VSIGGKRDLSSDQETQKIIESYNQGFSMRQIGADLGMSLRQMQLRIARLKKEGHDLEVREPGRFGRVFTAQETQKMIELYNQGVLLRDIGQELEYPPSAVGSFIRKFKEEGYDIKTRNEGVINQTDFMNDKRKIMKLIKLYQDGFTAIEIAHAIKISKPTFYKYLKILKEQGMEIEFRGQGKKANTKGKQMRISIPAKGSASSIQDNASNQRLQEIMQKQKRS